MIRRAPAFLLACSLVAGGCLADDLARTGSSGAARGEVDGRTPDRPTVSFPGPFGTPWTARPGQPVTPRAMVSCDFRAAEGAEDAVMALLIGSDLSIVRADGSRDTVLTFGETSAALGGTSYMSQPLARGEHLVAWAALRPSASDDAPYGYVAVSAYEVARVSEGQVDWHRVFDVADGRVNWLSALLGEDGTLALDLGTEATLVVLPNGDEVSFEGRPQTFMPNGRLLVRHDAPDYATAPRYEWITPTTGARAELARTPLAWGGPMAVGAWLVYVTGEAESDRLTLVAESEETLLELPFEVTAEQGYWVAPEILDAVPAGYLMLGHRYSSGQRWFVDLGAGTLSEVVLAYPEGRRELDWRYMYYVDPGPSLTLDDDGALLTVARDDVSVGLFRSTDLGATWQPLGLETRNVVNMRALGVAGTYLIDAEGVALGDWEEPEVGSEPPLDGGALQALRPDADVLVVLPKSDLGGYVYGSDLSADGRCLSVWQSDDEGFRTLRTFDLESGDEAATMTFAPSEAYTYSAWLPSRAPRPLWY